MAAASPDPAAAQGVARAPPEDAAVLEALRRGDERAFLDLVERYHASMVRPALLYVPSHAWL